MGLLVTKRRIHNLSGMESKEHVGVGMDDGKLSGFARGCQRLSGEVEFSVCTLYLLVGNQ